MHMLSTHEGDLPLSKLPLAARHAHRVPALASFSLMSVPHLCDNGCDVIFTANNANIILRSTQEVLYTATRDPRTRLYVLNIPTTESALSATTQSVSRPTSCSVDNTTWIANAAIGSPSAADLVEFSHASLCSPTVSTLETALKKNYVRGFPGLTAKSLRKHTPNSVATAKGHLNQQRARNKSHNLSKLVILDELPDEDRNHDMHPSFEERKNYCFAVIIEPQNQIFTDLTGRMVIPSSQGNQYIFVLYDYDSNAILVTALPNRRGPTIRNAFIRLHRRLVLAGLRPKLQRLDNEVSADLVEFMENEQINYQLVPPNNHRLNSGSIYCGIRCSSQQGEETGRDDLHCVER